jgi:WD40 repeat protein
MPESAGIFVSHSHEDGAFCLELIGDLRTRLGEDAVWYDTSGGQDGSEAWWDRIVAEITARPNFLVVLSPHAYASKWVSEEMRIAFFHHVELGKRLLPVRLAPSPRRRDWAGIQEFDFQKYRDPEQYAIAFDKLLQVLRIDPGASSPVSTAPALAASPGASPPSPVRQLSAAEQLAQETHTAYGQERWSDALAKTDSWNYWSVEGLLMAGRYKEAIVAAQSPPQGIDATSILPVWKSAIAATVQAKNWLARRELLEAALAAGADPNLVTRWRRLEFPHFTTLTTLSGHTGAISGVTWSPDGARLATGSWDKSAKVWEADSGRLLETLSGHGGTVYAVAWSPDSARLATGSWDKSAKVWEVDSGRLLETLSGHGGGVKGIAWSPDSARLATASTDHTVKVWAADSGRLLTTLSGHTGAISGVTWSPDGVHLATGGYDETAKVWEADSGRLLETLSGHTGTVYAVAWSPDSARLATASLDHTVKLWEVSSGRLLLTLSGHSDTVYSVSWSPDGACLATGSYDETTKVWEVSGGRLLLTLSSHGGGVNGVAWSPDGLRLASACYDKTTTVWGQD